MYVTIGRPITLASISRRTPSLDDAKSKIEIAVIDDNPFEPKEALLTHKFRLTELGPDIRSTDQISTYPIVICDVSGVAMAYGSELGGAHLTSEIKKVYPDKYVIAYTGMTYSTKMSTALSKADKIIEKDASIENWVQQLEEAIRQINTPINRWIRLRKVLLEEEVELFDVLKLEQAFIKSVSENDSKSLERAANSLSIKHETRDLILKFSATALANLVALSLGL